MRPGVSRRDIVGFMIDQVNQIGTKKYSGNKIGILIEQIDKM
jgi:hypothetical protein